MPSIHSSVSTRRAVRRQSTPGTRKPSVAAAMFSAISEMAAASSRRSISISVGAPQRIDDRHGAQAPRRRMEALDLARGEIVAVEVAAEAALDAGAQDLDGDLAAHAVLDHDRLVHLRDRGGGDRRPELDEMILELAAERLLDRAARLRHRERRQAVLQLAQVPGELRPDHVGAASPGTGRA